MLKINDNDEHKLDAHCFNTFGIISLGPVAFEVLMFDKSLNASVLCTLIYLTYQGYYYLVAMRGYHTSFL